ncbi:MAG: hypothetical protein KDK96_09685, partial [Chlamydiia bacterium]|nr:hypothetical protein [Chlamydiia bacterium]
MKKPCLKMVFFYPKLVQNFSEAWSEMVVGSDWGKDQLAQKNKFFSSNFIKKIKNKPENIEI